jgi:hypothetical protein
MAAKSVDRFRVACQALLSSQRSWFDRRPKLDRLLAPLFAHQPRLWVFRIRNAYMVCSPNI